MSDVEHVTFSGTRGPAQEQDVTCVTERCGRAAPQRGDLLDRTPESSDRALVDPEVARHRMRLYLETRGVTD